MTQPNLSLWKKVLFITSQIICGILFVSSIYFVSFVFKSLLRLKMGDFYLYFTVNVIILFINFLMSNISKFLLKKECSILKTKLRQYIFKQYSCRKGQNFMNKKPGEFQSITTDNVDQYVDKYIFGFVNLFKPIAIAISSIILLFYISWIIGLSSIAFFVLIFLAGGLVGSSQQRNQQNFMKETNLLSDNIMRKLELQKVFYLNNSQNKLTKLFFKDFKGFSLKGVKTEKTQIFLMAPSIFLNIISQVLIGIIGTILVATGHMKISLIASIGFMSSAFFVNLTKLTWTLSEVVSHSKMNKNFSIKQDKNLELVNIKDIKEINFSEFNVEFQEKNEHLFKETFNYKFNYKNKYVIVGESGVGKSTLIKSILHINDSYKGEITFNDKDSRTVNNKTFVSNFLFIDSKPFIFNDTIANNISMFEDNFNKNRVANILRLVNFEYQDINYTISNTSLSEGQRQKISIARAIYKKPNWIIIDEGLSNIDSKSKTDILTYLTHEFKGGLINITHHLTRSEEGDYNEKIEL